MANRQSAKRALAARRRRLRRGVATDHPGLVPGLDGRRVADEARGGGGKAEIRCEGLGADPLHRQEDAVRLLDTMRGLATSGNAIDLRLARLCAWVKTRDPAELGYGSHRSIFREHCPWADSWLRALIRLVQSDLSEVKAAACLGSIPITVAAKAPGSIDADQQDWWLERVQRGERASLPGPRGKTDRTEARTVRWVDLGREKMRVIHDARQLSRLVYGLPLSNAQADRRILDDFGRQADGAGLVRKGRQSPPPPPKSSPPLWCDGPDPATRVLGPWREPHDLADALRMLEQARIARDSRVLLLGQAFDVVASRALHHELGFSSLRDMAERGLDIGIRNLERYRRDARDLLALPALVTAVDEGLDLARAQLVASVARQDTVVGWIEVARRTGHGELRRAVRLATRTTSKKVGRRVLAEYRRAIDIADRLVAQALVVRDPGLADTTNAGAVGMGALRVFVSLNAAWAPPAAPRHGRVHAELPRAAAWFLDNVQIGRCRGLGKVKERADYTCRNPECGCRNLRVQVHHVHWRSMGGGDEDENLVCLCKPCHLRLVHTGMVSVARVGDDLVWRYPGRVVVAL